MLFSDPRRAAQAQQVFSAYTSFDADKTCKHTKGRAAEDYGSWVCPGHAGLIVRLSAGDQRMQVSFGRNPRAAANEVAASQTLSGVQQRLQRHGRMADGETAERQDASVRDHPALDHTHRCGRRARRRQDRTGQTFVVTRLNPGGVCHVGYVDARSPGANEAARKLADDKARTFKCGVDDPKK